MQQDGQIYSMEAGIVVERLGTWQDGQKYSMEAGLAAGQSEI